MTRDQQIRDALKLLAPPPGDRAECLHDVGVALDRVEFGTAAARSFKVASSKRGKVKLRSYLAALRRVKAAAAALDPAIRPWFSLPQAVIDREIATTEAFLARPPRPSGGSDASRKKATVSVAYDLLRWWNHKVVCTRGGEWAELAAILAGDQDLDLFDHMCAFKHSPAPTLVKVRDAEGSIIKIAHRRQPGIK